MKKAICILVLHLILFSSVFSQQKNYGVLFTGKNTEPGKRTGISLTNGSPVSLRSNFSIAFEFCIWESRYYGHLLKAESPGGFSLAVAYVQYMSKDTAFIELIINHELAAVRFPVLKKELIRNKWYSVSILLDMAKGKVQMQLGKETKAALCKNLPPAMELEMFIKGTSVNPDVPRAAMRDLTVKSGGRLLRSWKFDEAEGSLAHDGAGNSDAEVRHAEWLINRHITLRKAAEIFPDFNEEPGVTFDSAGQRILFTGKRSLYEYSVATSAVKKTDYKNRRASTADAPFFNAYTGKINSYYGGQGQVSIYDESTGRWTSIDTSKDFEQHYYLHAGFTDARTGRLYMFGGYGWYKCSNALQEYDFVRKKWIKIETSGDYIYPRQYTAVSWPGRDGKCYIFGGTGNKTGEQKLGFREVNDLFELDLNTRRLKKLWDLPGFRFNKLLFTRMIYNEEERCLYGAAYDHKSIVDNAVTEDHLVIFRLSLDKPGVEILNSFSGREFRYLYLPAFFYNQKTRELFIAAGIKRGSRQGIGIYSMSFPPLNRHKVLRHTQAAGKEFLYFYIAAAGLIITAAAVLYFLKRRKNKKSGAALPQAAYVKGAGGGGLPGMPPDRPVYRIRLFGEFTVLDKEGNDITVHFRPKIRQLFLLILVHTYSPSYRFRGITSEKLTSYLWPNADPVQAKNSRNSSIARLRGITEKTGCTEIVYENSLWSLKCDDGNICDYFDYLKLKDGIVSGSSLLPEEILRLLDMLGSGLFLQDVSYEWLDPLKASLESEVVRMAEGLAEAYSENDEMLLKISDILLLWDPANEAGLGLKAAILLRAGRINEAKAAFEKFSGSYKEITGRPFRAGAGEYFKSLQQEKTQKEENI